MILSALRRRSRPARNTPTPPRPPQMRSTPTPGWRALRPTRPPTRPPTPCTWLRSSWPRSCFPSVPSAWRSSPTPARPGWPRSVGCWPWWVGCRSRPWPPWMTSPAPCAAARQRFLRRSVGPVQHRCGGEHLPHRLHRRPSGRLRAARDRAAQRPGHPPVGGLVHDRQQPPDDRRVRPARSPSRHRWRCPDLLVLGSLPAARQALGREASGG
jgi:hypothetical protein